MLPESSPTFIWRGKDFKDAKSIENTLRFDSNGNSYPHHDSFQFVPIRSGLYVATFRVNPHIIPCYKFDIEDAPVGLAFSLSGKLETIVKKGQNKRPVSIVNQRGVNSVTCLHAAKGYSRYLCSEPSKGVIVYINPQTFTELIAEELGEMPKDCRRLLQQKNFFFSLPMNEAMLNTAMRAFSHPYQGTAERLHLESCGLELLALQIERLTSQSPFQEKPLNRADEERIRMAGDILAQNLDAPPTISALSLQVGINSNKLKKGFKQLFGTTIGQFLLQHRMTCAREMILNRQIDVTRAAVSVGYSNVSHFIRYYQKTFGVTPGSDKQTRNSRIILPNGKE